MTDKTTNKKDFILHINGKYFDEIASDEDLTPTAKLLFIYLLRNASHRISSFRGVEQRIGETQISKKRMAKALGMSRATVFNALESLQGKGLITRKSIPNEDGEARYIVGIKGLKSFIGERLLEAGLDSRRGSLESRLGESKNQTPPFQKLDGGSLDSGHNQVVVGQIESKQVEDQITADDCDSQFEVGRKSIRLWNFLIEKFQHRTDRRESLTEANVKKVLDALRESGLRPDNLPKVIHHYLTVTARAPSFDPKFFKSLKTVIREGTYSDEHRDLYISAMEEFIKKEKENA